MHSLNVQSAESYLAWFKAKCREKDHFVTIWNHHHRQVPRLYSRCLKIAGELNSRPARMFLRKWHADADRSEIIGNIGYGEIKGEEERAQAIEFLEDLTRFIRHVCSTSSRKERVN